MSRRVDGARGGFQARSRIRHGMGANAKSTAGSASRDLGGPAGQIHNPKAQKITTEGGQIEDRGGQAQASRLFAGRERVLC